MIKKLGDCASKSKYGGIQNEQFPIDKERPWRIGNALGSDADEPGLIPAVSGIDRRCFFRVCPY